VTPDTGGTYGSSSIRTAGPQIRAAAAYAQQALLGMAAIQLGEPVASLSVKSGVVSGAGKTITYGQLIGDKLFNTTTAVRTLTQFQAPAKPVSAYKLVGTSPPRIDIPDKVVGTYTYVHNIRVPGMLHARMIRPRGQGGYGTGVQIASVDESSIKHIAGARVLRKDNFLAVVRSARVRRDPGGAAQGEVGRESDPAGRPRHQQHDAEGGRRWTDRQHDGRARQR
jgi:nicotinate dehydrogenase subunit B